MIHALLIGRKGSSGFPGKNITLVLGKPLMAYPLLAAIGSKYIDKIFISTDSERIRTIAEESGAIFIQRPPELCTKESLSEDVFTHGYLWIKERYTSDIEMMVLLFCNAPTITSSLIDQGIEELRKNPDLDSAATVSRYNMWSPLRARKINSQGLLDPFVPFEAFGDPETMNCDRDSQGDVWFADVGVSVVRPRCLEHIESGVLPQKWLGRKIYALKSWGGLDVDYEWQVPQVEYWLKKHNLDQQ